MFEVLTPGLMSTIQDVGRNNYLSQGFAPSGAFDNFSLRIGNLMLGNKVGGPYLIGDNGEAGIEITLGGLALRVLKETAIAITGADVSPTLNDVPVPMWKTVQVEKDDTISTSYAKTGMRAYLTVAGGIDVPVFLGTKSTTLRASVGGFEGRALRKGDIIKTGEPTTPLSDLGYREVKPSMIPKYITRHQVRVILGPQDYLFTDEGVGTFLNHEWNVSSRLDRMGIRLMGPKLGVKPKPEYLMLDAGKDATSIVSDTIPVGGVQAPGRIPVILGVDGPSTGGYAKIATVISADISNLGQLRPENKIRFREVTIHQAQRALEEYEKKISDDSLLLG